MFRKCWKLVMAGFTSELVIALFGAPKFVKLPMADHQISDKLFWLPLMCRAWVNG